MNDKQALRVLIEAATRVRQEYAVGYHSHEKGYKLDQFERDHKRYEKLTEAIAWAEKKLEEIG